MAEPGEERVGHRAADQQVVHLGRERFDDADLVGHLRTAEHGHERTLGIVEGLRQERDLALQELARGVRELRRDACGGCVRAVDRPEGVRHEYVPEAGHLGREVGVVGRLARQEARVLEQHHRSRSGPVHARLGGVADGLVAEHDGRVEECVQHGGDRTQRVGRVRRALRTAEVRHQHRRAARVQDGLDRGQRAPDARVVGHCVAVHRDVEVHADEDAAAGQVEVGEGVHRIEFSVRSSEFGESTLSPEP